ncbi:MAG: efflux RND transporter permease subunit [Planctomycetota bacterium]|nr:efflux RND transporter permease subunit [Planctomycetota bacterium]
MERAPARGVLGKSLAFISQSSSRHPFIVLLIAALLSVGAWLAAKDMRVDATFLGIVNDNEPVAQHFYDVSKAYGGSENLLLLVECDDLENGKAFLKAIQPKLQKLETWIKAVDIQLTVPLDDIPEEAVVLPTDALKSLSSELEKNPGFYKRFLQNPGLGSFSQSFEEQLPKLAQSSATDAEKARAAQGLETVLTVLEQAVNNNKTPSETALAELFGASIKKENEGPSWEETYLQDGWIVSKDKKALLAIVQLRGNLLDRKLGVHYFAKIIEETDATLKDFKNLKAGYAGAAAYGYEDQQNVLYRTRLLSGLSLLLVLLLFLFIDRSLFGPFIVGLPLLLGTLWTFGLVRLFIGYVSLTSAVFGILLFGLGVDFAIHIVVRYNDSRASGQSHDDALWTALVLTGRGVVTGGLTSAIAFFGILVTDQKAAQHLGITTGLGLLCCLIAMLTVLPALLTLTQRWKRVERNNSMRVPLLERWVRWVTEHPKGVLAGAILLLLASLALFPQAHVEYDIEKIATKDAVAVKTKNRVEELFEVNTDFALCVCKTLEEAQEVTAKLRNNVPSISRVDSITDLFPANKDEHKAQLTALSSQIIQLCPTVPNLKRDFVEGDMKRVRGLLRKILALGSLQLQMGGQLSADEKTALTSTLERVKALLKQLKSAPPEKLAALDAWLRSRTTRLVKPFIEKTARSPILSDMPEMVRNKFIDKKDRIIVLAYPKESMLDGDAIQAFFEDLKKVNKDATGIGQIVFLFVSRTLDDLPLLIFSVSFVVLLVVSLDFRSAKLAFLVFMPLIFAIVYAVGAVILTGQIISVLMLSGFPLILGIGVDDGVHLVHRVLEDPKAGVVHAVTQTGKAILMTSITTMVSFGGLLLMNHHGLEGLGFLVTVGVGLCFITSVTIFPAVLTLVAPRIPEMQNLCK